MKKIKDLTLPQNDLENESPLKKYDIHLGYFYPTDHTTMPKGKMLVETLKGGFSPKACQIIEDFLSEEKLASDIIGFSVVGEEVIFRIGDKGNDKVSESILVKFNNN